MSIIEAIFYVFHRAIFAVALILLAGFYIWRAARSFGWPRALMIVSAILFASTALMEAAIWGWSLSR